ncbi:hypothetical protein NW062_00490 [Mycoplasmopsis cynos]|nr:hypothetical protein NW062_00490 [Mycoplasmopsis cynos]
MWDLFKQLEIDESLLEDSEEDLSIAKFLILKTKKTKLYKNTRYVLKNKVAFKVLESNLKNKKAIIEVSKL